jgi:acetylornithine aminotransferase
MNTYGRLPVSFVKGEGCWLYDADGNRYLDAISGIGVCNLGHHHPAVTQAICDQAHKVLHTSNLYGIEQQEKLAEKLTKVSGMERVFFANSGAEANEAAIKLARFYGNKIKKITNPSIVVMESSFHGRTLATLSATGNRKIQAGFEPLVSGFVRAPYNDLNALTHIAGNNPSVVAVLVEPVQGEGGVNIPDADYLNGVREICTKNGWLMMLDEVQTGNYRTGKYFAYQHNGILPDVVTTAKGLGNGVPIGACLAQGEAATLFQPGNHGSTFGGNPLACAAANAVLDTLMSDTMESHIESISNTVIAELKSRLSNNPHVVTIRHLGLMIGIELNQDCGHLVQKGLDKGILINVTAGKVIRLLPPLILGSDEISVLADKVCLLIQSLAD